VYSGCALNGWVLAFGYVIPLVIISVVLAVIFATRNGPETANENQTRATKIVVVVVIVFAVLWLPQMVRTLRHYAFLLQL